MTRPLRILVADDDPQFANSLAQTLTKRLASAEDAESTPCDITVIANLARLREIAGQPNRPAQWDVIICDLGWGDLTLEGIQILHDIQMNHPRIGTILYTAQDPTTIAGQALEWKLHFIDQVVRVDQANFIGKLTRTIAAHRRRADHDGEEQIVFHGAHLLPPPLRGRMMERCMPILRQLQRALTDGLANSAATDLAAEIRCTADDIQLAFKPGDRTHQRQRHQVLLEALHRFPRTAPHDLLPLAKVAFIEFIKERYGGFPQMAKERGLDLNNIYRVNRRFRNAPFLVFKYETIQEIVGIYDETERTTQIRALLCPAPTIKRAIAD